MASPLLLSQSAVIGSFIVNDDPSGALPASPSSPRRQRRRDFLIEANDTTRGLLERELREYIRDLPFEEIATYKGLPKPRMHTHASERAAQDKDETAQVLRSLSASKHRLATGSVTSSNTVGRGEPAGGGAGAAASVEPVEITKLRSSDYRYCVQELARDLHAPYEIDRQHISYSTYKAVLQAPDVPELHTLNPRVVDRPKEDSDEFSYNANIPVMPSQADERAQTVALRMTQAQYATEMEALKRRAGTERQKQRATAGPLDMYDLRPRGQFKVHTFRAD
jgi:hypothetical protein